MNDQIITKLQDAFDTTQKGLKDLLSVREDIEKQLSETTGWKEHSYTMQQYLINEMMERTAFDLGYHFNNRMFWGTGKNCEFFGFLSKVRMLCSLIYTYKKQPLAEK